MSLEERVFQTQFLIFITKRMMKFDGLSNCGVCLELGSTEAVASIIFPFKDEDQENPEDRVLEEFYASYSM